MSATLELRGGPWAEAPTSASYADGRKPRVIGVDVARGLALIGMMATHAFVTLDDNNDPTAATLIAGGRAATTFVLVAGVRLAFLSSGRTPFAGRSGSGHRRPLPSGRY